MSNTQAESSAFELRVHRVAAVFDEHDLVLVPEGRVVERTVLGVTEVQERQMAVARSGRVELQLHDRAETTSGGADLGADVSVSGLVEVELAEPLSGRN